MGTVRFIDQACLAEVVDSKPFIQFRKAALTAGERDLAGRDP